MILTIPWAEEMYLKLSIAIRVQNYFRDQNKFCFRTVPFLPFFIFFPMHSVLFREYQHIAENILSNSARIANFFSSYFWNFLAFTKFCPILINYTRFSLHPIIHNFAAA